MQNEWKRWDKSKWESFICITPIIFIFLSNREKSPGEKTITNFQTANFEVYRMQKKLWHRMQKKLWP